MIPKREAGFSLAPPAPSEPRGSRSTMQHSSCTHPFAGGRSAPSGDSSGAAPRAQGASELWLRCCSHREGQAAFPKPARPHLCRANPGNLPRRALGICPDNGRTQLPHCLPGGRQMNEAQGRLFTTHNKARSAFVHVSHFLDSLLVPLAAWRQ